MTGSEDSLEKLLRRSGFKGECAFGETMRRLYSTDASEYQEMPAGVVWPRDADDVGRLIRFALEQRLGLIPRTAGTSLAGQCVGSGLVVDLSRHFRSIVRIDPANRVVTVEPGVIRNELNAALAEHGLFFGPETSTANRAMMGGMLGNNSCGSNSIIYGSVREHVKGLRGFFGDGKFGAITPLGRDAVREKCRMEDVEGGIYRKLVGLLGDGANREEIRREFPKPEIPRRNSGYALDLLMDCEIFNPESGRLFDLCQLVAGSEGTLFFATEIDLDWDPLPPARQALVCCHFSSIEESLRANLVALEFGPTASELIDRHILECSRQSLELARNRDFVSGDPAALLVVEFREATDVELQIKTAGLTRALRDRGMGYAFPILEGKECSAVWDLRRAGQAVINHMPGDKKPREVAEDTAVDVRDLPDYIRDFKELMDRHGIDCVYYGHAATGELHMRPIFSLHHAEGVRLFRRVAEDVAALVKRYRGSLSGEHGDGRLRGEFLRTMIGARCYEMLREVKSAFDPAGIFNPGKIVEAPPMDESLRHPIDAKQALWETVFEWPENGGLLGAAEKCNGAGECLKTHRSGGTMCPSYMATRREEDSTRGRANLLRHLITDQGRQALGDSELARVLDLCLGCKGCKSECPSSVDVGRMKAEFLQEYHDRNGTPVRSRLVSEFSTVSRLARLAPWAWNAIFGHPGFRAFANRLAGFHPDRTIPLAPQKTWEGWYRSRNSGRTGLPRRQSVYLFMDEFTNYQEPQIGVQAVELLEALGYEVRWVQHPESGRSSLSKGFLRKARRIASQNVRLFHPLVSRETPLVGIEPSALLGFRDEYPSLLRGDEARMARDLAPHCFLIDEFLVRENAAGRISQEAFRGSKAVVRLHGHCHQKALSGLLPTIQALELVPGHNVRLIASGCCGMAGSFGYEAEHFDVSMQIGELVLFPAVRAEPETSLLCAPGTSCRHQIHDGTGRRALHPVEILHTALR